VKRALWSLAVAASVPALAWVGGFDFNERGYVAFMVALYTPAAGLSVWFFPSWKK
jgi:hypothetical protein